MFDRWIFTSPTPEPDARIAYGRGPAQFAELRLPPGPRAPTDAPIPTVVVIHGGFWLAEFNLDHLSHACADLATRGYATWSIEFRRLGCLGGGWPKMFRDVGAAVDRLREVAPDYGLDLAGLTALGHSAGGHLALWLAARAGLPEASPIYRADPLPVAKVLALAPLCDLHEVSRLSLCDDVVEQLMAGSPAERPTRYAEASPAARLPLGVPQVLVHGERDRLVPVELSTKYAAAAAAAGDPVSLTLLPDTGHFELIDPQTPQWARVCELLASP